MKGDLGKREEMRRALRETQFSLVRGPMRFNTNQFPIQNFYLVQAEKDASGIRMVYRGTIFEAHKDAYSDKCAMK